tara:strand:+ start:339 stop:863 length:525 start_codon:yes stop_codon:yes gene_type:complete
LQSAPLHVIHLNQDDPKKCTSRKLHQSGLINLHESVNSAPRRGYLLNPHAKTVLAPEDVGLVLLGGSIVVLDCSWKQIEDSLNLIDGRTRLEGRILPLLLAANPVSWGKVGRLSSVEALGASLAILGLWEQASSVVEPFPFGEQFLNLNKKPLEAYSKAHSREDIIEIQREFFN